MKALTQKHIVIKARIQLYLVRAMTMRSCSPRNSRRWSGNYTLEVQLCKDVCRARECKGWTQWSSASFIELLDSCMPPLHHRACGTWVHESHRGDIHTDVQNSNRCGGYSTTESRGREHVSRQAFPPRHRRRPRAPIRRWQCNEALMPRGCQDAKTSAQWN